jgi:hypothetical protein
VDSLLIHADLALSGLGVPHNPTGDGLTQAWQPCDPQIVGKGLALVGRVPLTIEGIECQIVAALAPGGGSYRFSLCYTQLFGQPVIPIWDADREFSTADGLEEQIKRMYHDRGCRRRTRYTAASSGGRHPHVDFTTA